MSYLVAFSVDQHQFAFDISSIERIIRAVEIIPVPNAAKNIAGMINIHGKMIPVVDMRMVLGLDRRTLNLTDQFIISEWKGTKTAVWIDHVIDLLPYDSSHVATLEQGLERKEAIRQVALNNKKIAFIYDIEELLQ